MEREIDLLTKKARLRPRRRIRFFSTDDSIPALTGVMKYKDTLAETPAFLTAKERKDHKASVPFFAFLRSLAATA